MAGKFALKSGFHTDQAALREGACNLLENCAGVRGGETVLIVRENSAFGYFDDAAPDAVADEARKIGAHVELIEVQHIDAPEEFPGPVLASMAYADHVIFFARLGDQIRFSEMKTRGSRVMCYAPDADFLGSPYGCLPHQLMCSLKAAIETKFVPGSEWQITCKGGTDLRGTFSTDIVRGYKEVTLSRFPMTTFRPVSCSSASGKVALANWLIGTGSRNYKPYTQALDDLAFAIVENGRIQRFEGPDEVVAKISAHYDYVANLFDIEALVVHSWHAGLHPQAYYPGAATDNLERWAGVAFANPRYLHFHTCGDYAPGEICWSCIDPTIDINGETLWQDGHCNLFDEPEVRGLFAGHPGFENSWRMRTDIGL